MSSALCSVHPGRPAVDTCASCGRPACLGCAVPVRGDVLCTSCAATLVGAEEAPPEVPPPRADVVAGSVFALAAAVTMLPWDRVGALTGFLSAWVPRRAPWAFVTVALTLLAAAASLRRGARAGWAQVARLALGVGAGITAVLAVPAPNLAARGPVPFVVVALVWSGVAISAFRAWRRP